MQSRNFYSITQQVVDSFTTAIYMLIQAERDALFMAMPKEIIWNK